MRHGSVPEFQESMAFQGDSKEALLMARNVFLQEGFEWIPQGDHAFEAFGPGMMSSKQNPILGCSYVQVRVDRDTIQVQAEFGGIRKMTTFLAILLPGLGLGLSVLFYVLFREEKPFAALIPFLALSPWVILGPLLCRVMREKASRALRTLMQNMSHCR